MNVPLVAIQQKCSPTNVFNTLKIIPNSIYAAIVKLVSLIANPIFKFINQLNHPPHLVKEVSNEPEQVQPTVYLPCKCMDPALKQILTSKEYMCNALDEMKMRLWSKNSPEIESQKEEIAFLTTQIETVKEQLDKKNKENQDLICNMEILRNDRDLATEHFRALEEMKKVDDKSYSQNLTDQKKLTQNYTEENLKFKQLTESKDRTIIELESFLAAEKQGRVLDKKDSNVMIEYLRKQLDSRVASEKSFTNPSQIVRDTVNDNSRAQQTSDSKEILREKDREILNKFHKQRMFRAKASQNAQSVRSSEKENSQGIAKFLETA